MSQNEKASGAGSAPEAKGYDDDDVNRRKHCNKNGARKQAKSAAERLFKLFYSDAKKHVEQRDFSRIENGKHHFKKTKTVPTPLTIELVQAHLDGILRVSVVLLQPNDTTRWGTLDVDIYPDGPDGDYLDISNSVAAPLSSRFQFLSVCLNQQVCAYGSFVKNQ